MGRAMITELCCARGYQLPDAPPPPELPPPPEKPPLLDEDEDDAELDDPPEVITMPPKFVDPLAFTLPLDRRCPAVATGPQQPVSCRPSKSAWDR